MGVLDDIEKRRGRGTEREKERTDKPKPSSTDSETLQRRKRLVKETIDDFASFAATLKGDDTSDPGNLPAIIRSNAEDLAFGIAAIAERLTPLGMLIDRVCGRGGILSIARSFSSIGKWIVYRIRTNKARRAAYIGQTPDGRNVFTDAEGFAALDDGTRLEQGSVIHSPDGETLVV